jgi:hypothetical protein
MKMESAVSEISFLYSIQFAACFPKGVDAEHFTPQRIKDEIHRLSAEIKKLKDQLNALDKDNLERDFLDKLLKEYCINPSKLYFLSAGKSIIIGILKSKIRWKKYDALETRECLIRMLSENCNS